MSSGSEGTRRVERSFCRFCEALCGIEVTVSGDRITSVRGHDGDPLSHGYTCSKGRSLGEWHHRADRLDHPLIRSKGEQVEVSWDECLADLAQRLAEIIELHGRDALGFYIATGVAFDANGRRTAERLRRAVGTKSLYSATTIDTPSKLLVSELMSGYPGLVPAPDRERGTLFLFFGTNPVVSHGHLNAFPDPVTTIRRLRDRGEVWVIDPRRTETAKLATQHLQIRPGTDYAVCAYLVRELIDDGADLEYLSAHASGLGELREAVAPFAASVAADICGVAESQLTALLDAVRRHGRINGQTGTGVTMSRTANVAEWLLWSLHIVTGSFDRPGGSWFHPGFLKRLDDRSAAPSDGLPGPGPESRPDIPGRWGEIPCAAMADEIEAGHLRALVVCGGNPLTAFPDVVRTAKSLQQLDVLAVADVVSSDTTALATHVLPVAGQLERADVPLFIDQFMPNVSTRYTPAVIEPEGERRPLWQVLAQLGGLLGYEALPAGLDAENSTDDDLLAILGDRSRSTFAEIREQRVIIDEEAAFGWVRDQVLPEGRWRLAPPPLVEQLEQYQPAADLVLIPQRQARHLNSMLRDAPVGRRGDEPLAFLHPLDADERGIDDGGAVIVASRFGELHAVARHDPALRRGSISLPHGFAEPNVSSLTTAEAQLDPLTGMVLQSGISVTVTPA